MNVSSSPIQFTQCQRPFFELPDGIKPPPGFPFVVLPADPVQEMRKGARRKLADNVVCLFSEERDPVVNIRWRGRYPPNVDRRYHWGRGWGRLHPGDYCMVWECQELLRASSKNHGALVRVLWLHKGYGESWVVEAVDRPIHTLRVSGPDKSISYELIRTAIFHEGLLRRCRPPERLTGLAVK